MGMCTCDVGVVCSREASPIDDNTWAVSDTEDIIDQFKVLRLCHGRCVILPHPLALHC